MSDHPHESVLRAAWDDIVLARDHLLVDDIEKARSTLADVIFALPGIVAIFCTDPVVSGAALSADEIMAALSSHAPLVPINPPSGPTDTQLIDWMEIYGCEHFTVRRDIAPIERWFDTATHGNDHAPTLRKLVAGAMVASNAHKPIPTRDTYGHQGAQMITAERQRQINALGYDKSHDQEHGVDQFTFAALAYTFLARGDTSGARQYYPFNNIGEFMSKADQPSYVLMAKAGALLAAGIDVAMEPKA